MKTIIVIWTNDDLPGIDALGVQQVWTEINEAGLVLREIGFNESNDVIYIAPSNHKKFGRGLFDNQIVSVKSGMQDDKNLKQIFERSWTSAK